MNEGWGDNAIGTGEGAVQINGKSRSIGREGRLRAGNRVILVTARGALSFELSCLKVARIRNNIHDPLEEDKRTSDHHRLATAEAQPEADAFCGDQVPV